MKQNKTKSPISILLAIVDKGKGEWVEDYLNSQKLKGGLLLFGKGTAESDIADIFGFGMSDKDIIACIVPVAFQEKVIKDVTKLTGIEDDSFGLTMLLDINSASSSLLDLLNVAY